MKRALVLCLLVACGGGDAKKYADFQACFDDKTEKDMKEPVITIVECCLDHEIAGAKPPHCGNDEPECINYLTTVVAQTDADITVKTAACMEYVFEKNKE